MGSEDERIERMYRSAQGCGDGLYAVLFVSLCAVMNGVRLTGIDVEDWCRDVEWFRVFCE
jgi:hypothetical protein